MQNTQTQGEETQHGQWGGKKDIWKTIRHPMIPSAEDVELVLRASFAHLAATSDPKILVLGVTPALIQAPWPSTAKINAVDFDPAMIEMLWSEDAVNASVTCADWRNLPFPDDHFDLVIGDCSFCALSSLDDYQPVLAELTRVKRSNAPLVFRFFIQPTPRLTLDDLPSMFSQSSWSRCSASARRLLIAIAASDIDAVTNYSQVIGKIEKHSADAETFFSQIGLLGEDRDRALQTFALSHQLNFPSAEQIEEQFSSVGLKMTIYNSTEPGAQFWPIIHFV